MSGRCDFHNHLIPGVDDGATDEAESEAALVALVAQGVSALVATPHVSGWLTLRPGIADWLRDVDSGWARLESVAARHGGVRVMRGAEIALDSPDLDVSDPRLRLNGGDFVLVEFAGMTVPPNSDSVLRRLRDSGVVPVLAHPERYAGLRNRPDLPGLWRDSGALLQVNAGSV
ncbi:MAG TPA: CpsB/CapC family capsule biosynthesis tyrosine phosphatase, partial [Longimicrobiales bacterium]|nr:CpsB/CapC family capsule biosynthesis tyrosine phosphatase [Longimicrobiales bacterium]